MLIAAMDWVGAGTRFPALVSATDFNPAAWPDDGDRWLAWEVYRRARVVAHPTNPGHQLGACWCVRQAVEYAAALGYEYLVFLADDVLLRDPAAPADMVARLRAAGADYLTSYWASEEALSTQVFACRVAALCDARTRTHRIDPVAFAASGVILESYVYQLSRTFSWHVLIEGRDYLHTHDPAEFFAACERAGLPLATARGAT
jgi:hypothetical protein